MAIVKFGDIVRDVKINVDRTSNPYKHYVAGDHMDSEDLTIHRYGNFATDDVGPAFTRIFKPGQILYGSRRTYLKKVAVADFEGICANTTFVLESKDDSIFDNRLLPFIMLSDAFTRWSIVHSKGSTNPYVLFSDLADYEFDLPSLVEQKILADKLWAAYRLKESYKKLLAATEEMVKSQFIEMFGTIEEPKCKTDSITSISENLDSMRVPIKSGNRERGQYPYYGASGIVDYVSDYIFDENILLISEDGANLKDRVTPIAFSSSGKVWVNNHAHVLRFQNVSLQTYVQYFLNFNRIDNYLTGTAQPKLNQDKLNNIPIPIPSMEDITKFVSMANQADKSAFELRKSIEAIDAVIKSLINS